MSLANPKRGTILTLLVICIILIHLGRFTSRFTYWTGSTSLVPVWYGLLIEGATSDLPVVQ